MAVDIQGHYAYIGNGRSFQILDITNLNAPVIVGEYVTSAPIYDVRLRGDSVAFICNWDGFLIFDVSNPTNPEQLSEILLWGGNRVIPTDSFAYVASGGLLNVIDISDLRNPYIRYQIAGDGGDGGRDEIALLKNRYIYLGSPDRAELIYAYDCGNPDHIQELPNLNIGWGSFSVRDHDSLLLVGGTKRIKIYSLTNPANPALLVLDTLGTGYSGINAITISDYSADYPVDVAFVVSDSKWLYTIDITYPSYPHVLDSISVLQTSGIVPISIPLKVQGTIGIAAYDGLFLIDAQNPSTLQAKSVFVAGGDGPLGITVRDQYAYLANGIGGLNIVNINNPTQPKRIGSLLCGGTEMDRVAIQGSYLYAVGHYGLWTVDVSNPQSPILTSWLSIGSPVSPPLPLALGKNRAYVAVYDSAVVIIDLTLPASPLRIGTYQWPTHGLPVDDLATHDSLLYVAKGDSLIILDVEDPQNVVRLSGVGVNIGAIVAESTLVFAAGGGLTIYNVSNPDSPITVNTTGVVGGDYMAISGDYIYLSQTPQTLTAVRVENLSSLQIVGTDNPIRSLGVAAQGRFIYLSEAYAGLQIFENRLISHQQNYSFDAGWNMISVPAFPGGNNIGAKNLLFPSSTSHAFTYESGYVATDTLVRGRGYWLKFDSPEDFLYTDIPVYSESISVAKGWNMIGSISVPVPVSNIGSDPRNIVTSQFFGFDGVTGYQIADTIQPGKGYWVRVNQATSLILPTELSSGRITSSNTIRIVPTSERPPGIPDPDISGQGGQVPKQYELKQNYPNPFNPLTTITYDLPVESHVQLKIYNLLGQVIATLADEVKKPGEYSITWDASSLSTGVYIYRFQAGEKFVSVKKMLILK